MSALLEEFAIKHGLKLSLMKNRMVVYGEVADFIAEPGVVEIMDYEKSLGERLGYKHILASYGPGHHFLPFDAADPETCLLAVQLLRLEFAGIPA